MKIERLNVKTLIFALFIISFMLGFSRSAYASEAVKAYDMLGNLLKVEDGRLVASSDVLFKLSGEDLGENEIYVCRINASSNEEALPIPLENGEYLLNEGEDTELDFYILDEVYGVLSEAEGGQISVSFIDRSKVKAEAGLFYEGKKENAGVIYLTGSRPYIRVSPTAGLETRISISDSTGNREYTVTEENTTLSFSEGSYGVTVYVRDGWGKITYAALPFKQFIYDNTAPGTPVVKISTETQGRKAGDNTVAFAGNIELKPESKDAVSGVEKYIFRFSDGSTLEGTSLVLEPPFEDRTEIFAVDRAGNISAASYIEQTVVLDNRPPVLSAYSLDADSEKASIKLEYTDDFSGMKRVRVELGDEEVFSRDFGGRNVNELISEFDMGLTRLSRGNNKFKAVLTDNAGNESEYTFAIEKQASEAPVIVLSGTAENQVHTGLVRLGIDISHDSDIRTDYRVMAIRKNEAGEVVWQRDIGTGATEFTEEGYYTIEAVAADTEGNTARLIRHFTIDTKAPVIAPLDDFNKKILSSFAFSGDPGSVISDYLHVDYEVLLNGQEYDGSYLEEPGKYVLKLVATDEFGRTSSEKAEFIISSNEVRPATEATETIISQNMLKTMRTAPVLHAISGRVNLPQQKVTQSTETEEVRLRDTIKEEKPVAEAQAKTAEPPEKEEGLFKKLLNFLSEWFSG